ncbi:MAG: hypothetical protein QN190_14165, partial [Armatimonadota bacterium]|nr:hypothetical protein [Armatimonadota bacterium]
KTYRITDTLYIKSKVRLLGKGYQSILRQDTAGKHGVRAAPVARPPGFDARTSATGTNPHIGITIENLHFASGVDWTQPGKPTAGVAIYLSSSRMVFLHQIWIDGYPDYRTKRWAGGIWFDDVDPANIPCRHTSVVGFFIQSIGDDTEYAGDADGVTYPNRKVGHTAVLLRMVNTGADGAPAWGHHFVNGVVQTEHATDSLEYYVGGQNAPGYRGFLNQGSEGVYFANAEFVDFVKVAEWNADADFSPSGLNKGRYESCVFEAPGFGEPAGRFRGPISQHEFWGCGFLGSGDPVFSGKSYGIDIDCATAAELWFLQCVFSAHAEGPDNTYAATQAIAIANSFGQLWQNRSPKFSECMITVHGTTFKNVPHGISATTGNVDGLGIVGCTFSGLNYAIRHSLLPGIQNNKSWTIIMNRFIDCTRTLMIASWSTTNTDLVIVGNSSPSGSSISVFFYAVASNTLMMNSRADMNLYRLRSMVSQGGLYVGNTSLSLLTEDSDGKIYPYYVWIVKGSYTTENTVQTLANYGFSGQAAQAGFFRYTCVISGANVGVYELTQGFRWNGTTLSLVGTVNKLQWETTPGLDASVAVSGEQLLFQVTPIGENPTTVEARIEMIPILRNP